MEIQPHNRSIFHIAPRSHWEQARNQAEYRAETLESEGFIYCSNIHQVLAVAEAFYSQRDDLVLLMIQTSRLLAPLKDEEGTSGVAPLEGEEGTPKTYPHIYGPINREAVTAVYDFRPDERGRFSLPQEVLNQCKR